MRSIDLKFDVTEATGIDEPVHVAGTLHLPDQIAPGAKIDLLLCLHGGGYRRSYWNPGFADESYSFAAYFTARGKAVLALDTLGMGESSKPERESKLSRLKLAAANAQALRETVQGLQDGRFANAASVSVSGIGHSMGGMMIITQAAAHGNMDRVAVLGWTNEKLDLGGADIGELIAATPAEGYAVTPRGMMRDFFYLPDVPRAIVEADEADGSPTPTCLGRDSLSPGIVHEAAAAITTPVLVVQAIVDTSPNPFAEVAYFKGSKDVTLSIMDGAAHCHNFASTRQDHWARLEHWIGG